MWHQHTRIHTVMHDHTHACNSANAFADRQMVEENGVKGRKREKWDEMLDLLQQKRAQERVAAPCRAIDLRFSRKEGTKKKVKALSYRSEKRMETKFLCRRLHFALPVGSPLSSEVAFLAF